MILLQRQKYEVLCGIFRVQEVVMLQLLKVSCDLDFNHLQTPVSSHSTTPLHQIPSLEMEENILVMWRRS